jgi:Protein of unknown function (DUF2950)
MRQTLKLCDVRRAGAVSLSVAVTMLLVSPLLVAQSRSQTTFASPEAAAAALVQAVKVNQRPQLWAILGPEMQEELSALNVEEAAADRAKFLDSARQVVKVERDPKDPGRAIIFFGKQEWPFPAPLVKAGSTWHFDSAGGVKELHDRQIGRNEIGAIEACNGYVDAQLDYFSNDWMGDGVLQFAQHIFSSPGKKDGLYWSNADGGPLSPLGPFVAEAGITQENPQPFSGYYYRILTQQGPAAEGGARSYIVDGRMVLGFALVAWPAEYGTSGVSTLIVNQLGTVYQKDLGAQTASAVKSINEFNPDSSWEAVKEED